MQNSINFQKKNAKEKCLLNGFSCSIKLYLFVYQVVVSKKMYLYTFDQFAFLNYKRHIEVFPNLIRLRQLPILNQSKIKGKFQNFSLMTFSLFFRIGHWYLAKGLFMELWLPNVYQNTIIGDSIPIILMNFESLVRTSIHSNQNFFQQREYPSI